MTEHNTFTASTYEGPLRSSSASWSLILGCFQTVGTTILLTIAFFIWSMAKTFPPDDSGHPLQYAFVVLLLSWAGIAGVVLGIKGVRQTRTSQYTGEKVAYAGLIVSIACIVVTFIIPFTWVSPLD